MYNVNIREKYNCTVLLRSIHKSDGSVIVQMSQGNHDHNPTGEVSAMTAQAKKLIEEEFKKGSSPKETQNNFRVSAPLPSKL